METSVDVFGKELWLVVLVALLLLTPITSSVLRKWTLALVNAGFLVVLLGRAALFVLAGALVARLLLELVSRARSLALVFLLGALLLAAFVLHKLPAQADALGLRPASAILAAVGFSYVALRLVEVFRAVHEGRHPPPDLASTLNYLLPFHSLAAGPIQAYDEFVSQPAPPAPLGARAALEAAERIALGLTKKFVLATTIERLLLTGFRASGPYFLLEVQLNFLWVYLDFSAYSDIAVGIGRLLGVATPENFDRPYLARNMGEYWERWHMSLSLWIKRNVFVPIQLALVRRGARPLAAAAFAFILAFSLCGLWHQLGGRWLAWGAANGLALTASYGYKQFLTRRLGRKGLERYLANKPLRVLATVLTYELVAFTLVIVM